MVALTHLRLPTHPRHSLTPTPATPLHPPLPLPHTHTHPLIRAICDITVAVKKVAQNPAVLAI